MCLAHYVLCVAYYVLCVALCASCTLKLMEAVEVTAIELNVPNEAKKKVTLFFKVLTICDINSG